MAETTSTNTEIEDPIELEVQNFFKKSITPTEDDLARELTREEQIELCLRLKCRVDIWRWNPVYEYRLEYTESGRYQRWNNKLRLRMLAHSINLRKPGVIYDDNEVAKIRKTEWEMQKKNSILSLNFWNHQREKQAELQDEQLTIFDTDDPSAQEINSILDDSLINDNTSDPATDPEPAMALVYSEDIDNVDNLFNYVNTESMTLGTQSQMTEQHLQPSQDVLSPDYDNFNNEIPLTSTQSQHPEIDDFADIIME